MISSGPEIRPGFFLVGLHFRASSSFPSCCPQLSRSVSEESGGSTLAGERGPCWLVARSLQQALHVQISFALQPWEENIIQITLQIGKPNGRRDKRTCWDHAVVNIEWGLAMQFVGPSAKWKHGAPRSKIIKDVKTVTAEHWPKCGPRLSSGPLTAQAVSRVEPEDRLLSVDCRIVSICPSRPAPVTSPRAPCPGCWPLDCARCLLVGVANGGHGQGAGGLGSVSSLPARQQLGRCCILPLSLQPGDPSHGHSSCRFS